MDLYRDFVFCRTTAPCGAEDTTIAVDSTARFPSNAVLAKGEFYLSFESALSGTTTFEVVQVLSTTPTSITVKRGQAQTIGVGHEAYSLLRAPITSDMMERVRSTLLAELPDLSTPPDPEIYSVGDAVFDRSTRSAVTAVIPRYSEGALAATPLAYYRLDESGLPRDAVGTRHAVSKTGTQAYKIAGPAKEIDGYGMKSTEAIVLPTMLTATTGWSEAGWVYLDSASMKGQFAYFHGIGLGVGSGAHYELVGNRLMALYEGNRWIDTGVNIGTGWHFVALVVKADGRPRFFLDGAQIYDDTTGSAPLAITSYPTASQIFATGNRSFAGGMSGWGVWNRVLTNAEVASLFNVPPPSWRTLVDLETPLTAMRTQVTTGVRSLTQQADDMLEALQAVEVMAGAGARTQQTLAVTVDEVIAVVQDLASRTDLSRMKTQAITILMDDLLEVVRDQDARLVSLMNVVAQMAATVDDTINALQLTASSVPPATSVVATSTARTAAAGEVVLATATTAALAVTLPAPTLNAQVTVKKVDASANAVTVTRAGAALIDGEQTFVLASQYDAVILVADGTNWWVV